MTGSVQRRSVDSFFADPGSDGATVWVCRGLSCELNGGRDIAMKAGDSARALYCLGHCDRAPAILLPGGAARCGAQALAWPGELPGAPARVDIRLAARRAIVTERIGRGNHADLTCARRAGVYVTLATVLGAAPETVLESIESSGERGRGGAGFPTGRKLRMCATAPGDHRCVIANGDEGDPGSFIDRVLLEDDPHAVIEGLALCAYAIGASEGVVFIRAEYPLARARMQQAILEARAAGLLGVSILGGPFSFDIRVVGGRGSYVCGEETALLNAIEDRRGEVRLRPPYPVESGLYGVPTAVNNIETLVNIPWILREGPAAYRALGTTDSPGTKAFCLNRGFARPGIIEAEFGVGLRELIANHGGGSRDGGTLAAVAVGGPMGSVLVPEEWDVSLDHASMHKQGVRLGHGGLVAIPASKDLAEVLVNWVAFMAEESCGKCVPCRAGSRAALDIAVQIRRHPARDRALVDELARLMSSIEAASLCGFGQGMAEPINKLARLTLQQGRPDGALS